MCLQWPISNVKKEARTSEEISQKAKLPKSSQDKYNCCRDLIFPFIPIDRVIINRYPSSFLTNIRSVTESVDKRPTYS